MAVKSRGGQAGEAGPDRVGDLSRALLETAQSIRGASVAVLAELGLSDSQANLLWELDPGREPRTMRALAATLVCDPSNVTLLGDALVRAGLAERRPLPTDRRARAFVLTDEGRALWERLRQRLEEASPLGVLDARQRHELRVLLETVQRARYGGGDTPQDHQEPRALPQRRRRGQAALAGDP